LYDTSPETSIPEGGWRSAGLPLGTKALGSRGKISTTTTMKLTWTERGYLALWYLTLAGLIWVLAKDFHLIASHLK